jgi:osmotically-inducible protein OsmY
MNSTDENIKKGIIDELYWDNRIDASQIKITVKNGIITLSGKVPTYNDLSSARVAARRINGVVDVIDEMIVSYATTPALPTDMEIKERVEDILAWDPVIDEAPILVSVKSGIVTLDGTVDAYWKKAAVENKISGIRGVLNI